tara:strand:+ start:181 stop:354 length:174 start_codon:yes stop_codon:yes gene_type:complete
MGFVMVNLFLIVVMIVIALDSAVEYLLNKNTILRDEFTPTLIWRFIAVLLIILAISK